VPTALENPSAQMRLPEHDQVVETFHPDRTDQPLDVVSFPKIQSGGIRAVRQNQRIIQCDVRDHLPACSLHSRSVQATTPA
jgi:hypothetical protein